MSNLLCIDTISSAAGVTVVKSNEVFYESLDPKKASESIIDLIDQGLKQVFLSPNDLNGVMVIKGPGSFTGLRVGISVANQFSHQLKIPIVGLRTDEWCSCRAEDPSILYLQSMNRSEVFVVETGEYKILPIEALESFGQRQWMGELKFDHDERLPSAFERVADLNSIEETWKASTARYSDRMVVTDKYDVVLPFYGKKPNITPSKKKVGFLRI